MSEQHRLILYNVVFPREANTSLIVRLRTTPRDILKDMISSKQKLYLYKKDINCRGGNAYSFLFFHSM